MEKLGLQQERLVGVILRPGEVRPHRLAGAEQVLVRAVGVAVFTDVIHGCEDLLRLFLDLPLFVVRKGLRHIVSPPLRREVDLQLDAELLGQRVLDGEAVIPIGDLAQTANEARLVQRHDLLALGDAGGRKSIAAQADVRRQSCCLAVARQRYGRDDMAFPLIRRLLLLFGMANTKLYVGCTAGTVLAFALVYVLIYSMTARSYYKIVEKA